MAKKNTRNSYPFHIMLGRKPAEGERRTYQVITTAENAASSTQSAESLINKLIKDKTVELNEGDHLVVAQITRVRALKAIKRISQIDEDPNDAFGDTGTEVDETSEEEVEIEDGEVSDEGEENGEETGDEGEATSEVELPDEEPEAAAPAPAPVEKKGPPAAATPPPEAAAPAPDAGGEDSADLDDEDPLADLGESEGDIVQESEKEKSEDAPAADGETAEGDGEEALLDELF